MGRLEALAKERNHARTIETVNYSVDATHMLSVGRLRDLRDFPSFGFTENPHPAGPMHDLEIFVLLRTPDLLIEDIEVAIHKVPRDDCLTLAHSLDAVVGISVSRGFTDKVKSLAGGKRGCTHLVHLLSTMAPAILQGYWAMRDREEAPSPEAGRRRAESSARYLKDSCYTWREDGEAFQELLERAGGGTSGSAGDKTP